MKLCIVFLTLFALTLLYQEVDCDIQVAVLGNNKDGDCDTCNGGKGGKGNNGNHGHGNNGNHGGKGNGNGNGKGCGGQSAGDSLISIL